MCVLTSWRIFRACFPRSGFGPSWGCLPLLLLSRSIDDTAVYLPPGLGRRPCLLGEAFVSLRPVQGQALNKRLMTVGALKAGEHPVDEAVWAAAVGSPLLALTW